MKKKMLDVRNWRFSLDRLTNEISKGRKLKKRLEENDRLQMLHEETKRFYDFL
jgi:hypothetical protein